MTLGCTLWHAAGTYTIDVNSTGDAKDAKTQDYASPWVTPSAPCCFLSAHVQTTRLG